MTIQEAIDRFRALKAHSRTVFGTNSIYGDANLIAWLWECDKTIWVEFLQARMENENCPEFEPESPYDVNDQGRELLMESPYDEGYLYWLEYKVKYYEEETEQANNALLLFRDKYDDYRAAVNRIAPADHKTRMKFW